MSFPDPLVDLRDKIARFGWAIVDVDNGEDQPRSSYTVGLSTCFNHPEVIVFGLSPSQSHGVLKAIEKEVREGHRFEPFEASDRVIYGFDCEFRSVAFAAMKAYMGLATRLFSDKATALHCIWPDAHRRFPWDTGATDEYRRLQPMISDGPEPWTFQRP